MANESIYSSRRYLEKEGILGEVIHGEWVIFRIPINKICITL